MSYNKVQESPSGSKTSSCIDVQVWQLRPPPATQLMHVPGVQQPQLSPIRCKLKHTLEATRYTRPYSRPPLMRLAAPLSRRSSQALSTPPFRAVVTELLKLARGLNLVLVIAPPKFQQRSVNGLTCEAR